MKIRRSLPVILPFLIVFASCKNEIDDFTTGDKIAVQWELITNFTDEKGVFDARFVLKNDSDIDLNDKNWALFFNMAPRPILENKTQQPADVQHINGDWYKLVPNEGFELEEDDTLVINYRGTEAVIKETDRPLGLYFVFYDELGEQSKIVEVSEYSWTPFTRPEQINRSREDAEPIPTPEWNFKNNQNLKEVSETEIKRIIPSPLRLQVGEDRLEVSNSFKIYYRDGLANEAQYLASSLKEVTGTEFDIVTSKPDEECITLALGRTSVGGTPESYQLKINGKGIQITGSGATGAFYGVQSLRALIPIINYQRQSKTIFLPHVVVDDAPRFAFRGLHLDVSRNFQTKETVLRLLDLMSFYKLNRFLFYTTEDEGWRLEIPGLPELTTVGAMREHTYGMEAPVLHPAYGSGPFAGASGKYGHGYYTREDFIEILKYASARHIKVIPELNFPGHARAAIKAMEARHDRLMKEGKEAEANEYRLIDPDDRSVYLSAQGYKDNVVCVARESTYNFYLKVVDEIRLMFLEAGLKMDEFHTGGDEVPEGAWTKSPMAADLMKRNPDIKDPKNLQTYFFRELITRLAPLRMQIDGWEEVGLLKTEDGRYFPNREFANRNVNLFIWNNLFDYDLGYRLANAGYGVVLCNVSNFYFDLAYSKDPLEPGLYWAGFVDTRNAFAFAPYDMFKTTNKNSMGQKIDLESGGGNGGKAIVEHLAPQSRKNILGVEAQVWSETIKGRDMVEYYILPKLVGFAESAWAPERKWEKIEDRTEREESIQRDWSVYAQTLAKKELPRLSYLNKGYNYRIPPPGCVIEGDTLKANVEYPGLIIRYTSDGKEPTHNSSRFEKPLRISGKGTIKLKSFDIAGKSSRSVTVNTNSGVVY
jgi:hexosaminidase